MFRGLVDLADVPYISHGEKELEDEKKYSWLKEGEMTEDRVNEVAFRLAQLWDLRENSPKSYINDGYGKEKEAIYYYYGDIKDLVFKARVCQNKI